MIFLLGACVRAVFIRGNAEQSHMTRLTGVDSIPPPERGRSTAFAPALRRGKCCRVGVAHWHAVLRLIAAAAGPPPGAPRSSGGRHLPLSGGGITEFAALLSAYAFGLRVKGRGCLALLASFILAGSVWPPASSAQDYPAHPVKIIVPFGAGGPADVYARVLAQHLSEELKQLFVVEDRPGAGSIIGTDAVAKSAPDGYTLLVMSNTHTTNESLIANKPFQSDARLRAGRAGQLFRPGDGGASLGAGEGPARSSSRSRRRSRASSTTPRPGPGTPYHMAGELFKAMSGTNIVHVPHKASGEARNSVIGGHVQMMFDAITTMAPNVKAGQVRALGTTAQAALDRACRTCRPSPRRACPATRRRSGSASWRRRARRKRSSTSSMPRSTR